MKNIFTGLILTMVLFIFCGTASAYKLPDTGQTKCHNTAGAEIPCSGTGQDGEYNINPLSYTDHGDGTVTDKNTGLMWKECSMGHTVDGICSGSGMGPTYNWYQASGTYDATYNPSSEDVCGALDFGGYSDWRLPSKKELISIVDFSVPYPGPASNNEFFPNTISSYYWSSTTVANEPLDAWVVDFDGGGTSGNDKKYSVKYFLKTDGHFVRCVRGDRYPPRSFTDNGNGTVTDNITGLVWQQAEPGDKTWQAALDYCNALVLGNMPTWRLPNVKELESLVDDTIFMPAIDTDCFPNAQSGYYWASTTYASYPFSAWGVFFYDGVVQDGDNKSYVGYTRCVREPSIIPAGLTLTAPIGGETWLAGTTQTITWSYTGNPGASVKIKLLLNGITVGTIVASTPVGSNGSGSFDWNIPLSQITGTKYRIKIMSTIDGSFKDTSDANFAISPPSLTVTSPNGSESWTRGTQQLIQWTYKGNPGEYVKIKLLRRGVTVRTITPSTPIGSSGNGSFAWDIPLDLAAGGKYQIKISSTGSSLYKDKSDGNFSLQ